MGSISTIPVPDGYATPEVKAFTPDRLGVRKVIIDIARDSGKTSASLTPCPANADQWGPTDAPEVSCPDLIAELMGAPDSAEKMEALQAIQRISADLVTVAAFVLKLRDK